MEMDENRLTKEIFVNEKHRKTTGEIGQRRSNKTKNESTELQIKHLQIKAQNI